ncbi:hypothetical protein [Helicobacter cetorum]|nr:hypothetical protein [Helicobacter cetorum]
MFEKVSNSLKLFTSSLSLLARVIAKPNKRTTNFTAFIIYFNTMHVAHGT